MHLVSCNFALVPRPALLAGNIVGSVTGSIIPPLLTPFSVYIHVRVILGVVDAIKFCKALFLQAESEAQHQRKVSEAEAFLKSNAAGKAKLAAVHEDKPSTHDEL